MAKSKISRWTLFSLWNKGDARTRFGKRFAHDFPSSFQVHPATESAIGAHFN